MSSTLRSSLPNVTMTRFVLDPGQILSARELFHGLRRPLSTEIPTYVTRDASCHSLTSQNKCAINYIAAKGPRNDDTTKTVTEHKAKSYTPKDGPNKQVKAPKTIRRYTKKTRMKMPPPPASSREPSPLFHHRGRTDEDHQPGKVQRKSSRVRRKKQRRAPTNELALVPNIPMCTRNHQQVNVRQNLARPCQPLW